MFVLDFIMHGRMLKIHIFEGDLEFQGSHKNQLFQLRERDEKLGEAGELQRFLGNLDHFQQWLSRTQTTVASEDIPNSLADAEKLLNQHQQLKDEIDAYAPEYAKMKDFGDKVTEGQEDPQYMFLRQVYKLSTGVLYIFHDLKQ